MLISVSNFVYLVSFIQSIFFAFATYYLTRNLSKTSLAWIAIPTSLLISFNPTLSFSTLAVGYEAPVAACFMMVLGNIISSKTSESRFQIRFALYAGAWVALASFMQPRYLLAGFVIFVIWALSYISKKQGFTLAAVAIAFTLLSPVALIARNAIAIDKTSISTNLGVTMAIGAGDETKGGYNRTGPEVPCAPTPPADSVTDNQKVKCVVKWYLTNPLETMRLSFNKAKYFWSPWSGPEATGTMARNPWLKISPVQQVGKSTQDGQGLVFGFFGVAVSYLWIIGQILFLFLGYRSLRKLGRDELFFGQVLITPVLVSWLLALGTIGDHRFRVPTMSMSLALQVIAILALRKKLNDKVS